MKVQISEQEDWGKLGRQIIALLGMLILFFVGQFPAKSQTDFDRQADLSNCRFLLVSQVAPQLKPDVPKMDSAPLESKPPENKTTAPLQGKVQVDGEAAGNKTNLFGGAGRFFGRSGKARTGRAGALRGETQDQGLSAGAESGIGIIGVKFVMFMGRAPIINRVFPQTPAFQMGMLTDDIIVAVDGVPTAGLSKEEVYDMIVGKPGTPVTISVQRNGDFKVFNMVRMDLNDITDPFVRRDYMRSM